MVSFFDDRAKKEIEDAIRRAEHLTSGQIRVHLKSKCKEDVFHEARKIFHRLRMHHAKHKNAVLIFVAPESKKFAVLGDRGIHEKVGDDFWKETRDAMASFFSKGQMKEGIVAGVTSVGEKLKAHFPHAN